MVRRHIDGIVESNATDIVITDSSLHLFKCASTHRGTKTKILQLVKKIQDIKTTSDVSNIYTAGKHGSLE